MDKYYIFVGMGAELIGVVLTMAYIGSWVDKTYELNGISLVGFIFIGLISWFYHLVFLVKSIERKEKS